MPPRRKSWFILRFLIMALLLSVLMSYVGVSLIQRQLREPAASFANSLAVGWAEYLDTEHSGLQSRVDFVNRVRHKGPPVPGDFWIVNDKGEPLYGTVPRQMPTEFVELARQGKVHEPVIYQRTLSSYLLSVRLKTDPPLWTYVEVGPRYFSQGYFLRGFSSMVLVVLFGSVCSSAGLMLYFFRAKSREAKRVLAELASGNLTSRFQVTRYDEIGELMGSFNQMADHIQSLVLKLQTSEETRKELVGELGHDLRTPITAVRVALDALEAHGDKLDRASRDRLIQVAKRELAFMQRLLQYLFTLAREGIPDFKVNPSNLELNDLLGEVIQSRAALEAAQGESKTWNWAPSSSPAWILGDRAMLLRVVQNLLDNARKYARTSITISIELKDSVGILSIGDDGPGMAGDPFAEPAANRVNDTTSEKAAQVGTSLGLGSQIVRAIVDLHEWKYSTESHESGAETTGTTVRIEFPLKKQAATKSAA